MPRDFLGLADVTPRMQCNNRGMGFDPSSGFCVLLNKNGDYDYFDAGTGQQLTSAPIVPPIAGLIQWPDTALPVGSTPPGQPPIVQQPFGVGSGSFVDGAMVWLRTQGLFGLEYWQLGLIAAGVVVAVAMSGSAGKKKGGWI